MKSGEDFSFLKQFLCQELDIGLHSENDNKVEEKLDSISVARNKREKEEVEDSDNPSKRARKFLFFFPDKLKMAFWLLTSSYDSLFPSILPVLYYVAGPANEDEIWESVSNDDELNPQSCDDYPTSSDYDLNRTERIKENTSIEDEQPGQITSELYP